jgi:hypothetical protein
MAQTTQPRSWTFIDNPGKDLTIKNRDSLDCKSTDYKSKGAQPEDLLYEDTQSENLQSSDFQSADLQGEDNLNLLLSVYDSLNRLSEKLNKLDYAISRKLIKQNYFKS